MELTFPLFSPNIDKIEIVKPAKKRPRRARLYYLRERIGREAVTA
jgi:ribosomal protein L19